MKKRIIFLIIVSITFFSLFANEESSKGIELEDESLLMAVLWQQTSAEYRALAFQAYNIARFKLDEELKFPREKKRAIIVDVDETVLENSMYNAKGIIQKQKYPDDFYKWIDSANAEEVHGAKDFLNYAVSEGCDVFYISNRRLRGLNGTIRNLQKLGFPQADEQHVFLKDKISSKEPRREKIAETHYIALIIGDNLIDFTKEFEYKSIEERYEIADKFRNEFGSRFIILPNPMHGSWKKALYDYERNLTKEQMMEKRIQRLKTW